VLAAALDQANTMFLNNNKSPSRKVGELDTRGSHFYLAMYWAQALAEQDRDSDLQAVFTPIAKQLTDHEETIVAELNAVQGKPADLGGYYRPDRTLASKVMRPSRTLNAVIDSL
jgi:isocitrate dehydrogenase